MTTKEEILRAIEEMPDDVSIDDVMDRLFLLDKNDVGEMVGQKDLQARLKAQGQLRKLRGKVNWVGDLDAMRRD